MSPAQGYDAFRESLQVSINVGPVEPGDRVVLAVGVVVALLGAADLVAAQEERDAEGQQERREHGPPLAGPQSQHVGVVVGALGPTVPRTVVVRAVPVGLAVGLVVLAVVGNEVGESEPVVDRDAG